MLAEGMAALRALPIIAKGIEQLAETSTQMAAQKRREEKDETLDRIIDSARRHKLHNKKIQRLRGNSGTTSGGSTDGGGI